jgi:Carboxypeptidase regulatory-like domain
MSAMPRNASRQLAARVLSGLLTLGALGTFACGDPNDPGTTGMLAGLVRDAETDAPIEGVTLLVAGIQVHSGNDGRFTLDSVPAGTQQVVASKSGYIGQTVDVQIQAGETEEITVELVADLGPPGPSGVSATADPANPGTVRVNWDPLVGATSYVVYWGTHSPVNGEQGVRVADAPNPFVHTELSGGTTYYYAVAAIGPDGETRPSAEVSATPDGPISIHFVNPKPLQFVEARFSVTVEIRSVFQLTSVTAQVGAFTDILTYHPESDEWEGFFDLGDTPSPSFQTVHYTATDAAGNTARTAVLLRFDKRPVVTMSSPQDDAFAAQSLRVAATCTDDHPAGCQALVIYASAGSTTIRKVVAQASVDQTISLAEFDGTIVTVSARGADFVQDRIPRNVGVARTVYVDASPQLDSVASSGTGILIDANATHLLAFDGSTISGQPTDTLRRVDRGSGHSTVIHSVLHERARAGALFTGGVIFFSGSHPNSIREWRNGISSIIGTEASELSLKVEEPYAIWSSSSGVVRRQLTTGTNVTVVNGPTHADVAANGDVVWNSGIPYEIFLFRDGTNTQLTNDGGGEFGNSAPVTDGIHIVYNRHNFPPAPFVGSIRLSDPGGEITLASNVNQSPFGLEAGDDYEVNDGWIAFARLDMSSTQQIWRRSPAGEESQVSAFGEPSTIEAMGPDGEIVFTSEATGTERRYRARVGESPDDISSELGEPVYIDGQLHVMMGATLLRVD